MVLMNSSGFRNHFPVSAKRMAWEEGDVRSRVGERTPWHTQGMKPELLIYLYFHLLLEHHLAFTAAFSFRHK